MNLFLKEKNGSRGLGFGFTYGEESSHWEFFFFLVFFLLLELLSQECYDHRFIGWEEGGKGHWNPYFL